MKTLPSITIITPVFNGEKYLERTILSVLDQKYPDLEYVIVDGGSTDGTLEIIKKYETQLSRWTSEPDRGMYDALNKGFAHTRGEIMGWINADDLHHDGSLWRLAEIFTTFQQVNWVTGIPTVFDSNGICREIVPQRKWSVYQYLTGDYFTIQQESVFWRRSLWEKSGASIRTDLRYAGDFELWMRFFRSGEKLHSTRALLGGFRRHSALQLSHLAGKYASEVKSIYAELKLTSEERDNMLKIKRLNRIKRFPGIRGFLQADRKLNEIMDFPPEIRFDFENGKYSLFHAK